MGQKTQNEKIRQEWRRLFSSDMGTGLKVTLNAVRINSWKHWKKINLNILFLERILFLDVTYYN